MKKQKKILIIAAVLFSGIIHGQAQQVANFENLSLETETYFDGGANHSGTEMQAEIFHYQSGNVHFSVNHTIWSPGSSSYGGMAYSNMKDTVSADFTNFSAYADPNKSSTYGVFYPSWGVSDSIAFESPVNLSSVDIANHTWTYHYMKGTDGSGTGTFSSGDSLSVIFTGYDSDNQAVNSVQTHLADFTNGNAIIIDDWTTVDLSAMTGISYVKIQFSSSDSWAPTYVCLDDLTYSTATGMSKRPSDWQIKLYPMPVVDYLVVENAMGAKFFMTDGFGRVIKSGKLNADAQEISMADFSSGIYFITLSKDSQQITRKIIK